MFFIFIFNFTYKPRKDKKPYHNDCAIHGYKSKKLSDSCLLDFMKPERDAALERLSFWNGNQTSSQGKGIKNRLRPY